MKLYQMSNATVLLSTFSQHIKHQVHKQQQHQLHTPTKVILHIKSVYSYYHVGPTPSSNLSFPPHKSHKLQPLDVSVCTPFKSPNFQLRAMTGLSRMLAKP